MAIIPYLTTVSIRAAIDELLQRGEIDKAFALSSLD